MGVLDGKVALITGASRGIGRGTALELARRGADVAVLAAHRELLEQVAAAIESEGRRSLVLVGDVRSMAQMRECMEQIKVKFGRLDILVNNVGINPRQKLDVITEEVWDMTLDVNLKGMFILSKLASEIMIPQHEGRIINMSSVMGKLGGTAVDYSASKAGVIGLTKCLARSLAPYNILVNAVAPGTIDTEPVRALPPERFKQLVDSCPLHRIGRIEEVAGVIAFLAGPDASYITGSTLDVNGGQLMN